MEPEKKQAIVDICKKCGNDRSRLMDVAIAVQNKFGQISGEAMEIIAGELKTHRVEVESLATFYAFLNEKQKGKVVIRVCNDVVDRMFGADLVEKAFEQALGIKVGETTKDGKFTLERTACIGMSDQAPAAMVNDVIVTELTPQKVQDIVRELGKHLDPKKLVTKLGDGNNANELVRAMVKNNLKKSGGVIFADEKLQPGEALKRALALSAKEVINTVKNSRLRGRGGAGFPAGMKWEFTAKSQGNCKYVVCNADEGEPGTFKDRVLLTEAADLMFEGMTIAGYAIGACAGLLYLRGEYEYLHAFLEQVLKNRRQKGLLGTNVGGKDGFNFDIRIQMGAGAYVCGEETALLSSCEGIRGQPKNRPPFPAQKGYLEQPTVINNVETYCCVTRIMEKGAPWFAEMGSSCSSGTKLLSISGDCKEPGVYELPFGITIRELLSLVKAENTAAVQIGGPSGQMIGPKDFDRIVCYDDLATGGSLMIFNRQRNLLEVASNFMEFFVEESCGYCVPCRVGNVLLKERLDKIIAGKGEPTDLAYLEELGHTVKAMSRCGLGQTSPNPVMTTLKNFRSEYESRVKEGLNGQKRSFDLNAAVSDAEQIAGRKSGHDHA